MRQPQAIAEELNQISTINNLSGIFETIASMQISRIKQQVLASKDFFSELWRLYTEIAVEDFELNANFGTRATENKDLFLVITGEGGFSGDIDQKLIEWMLKSYDKETTDIVVIGHHGAVQLAQRGVAIRKYYKMPSEDKDIDVSEIMEIVTTYPNTKAFYQTYVSLTSQDVKSISLQAAVKNLKDDIALGEAITTTNYIFEPSDKEVVKYLESTMLNVALVQIIFESKLAQYASRFRAMTAAHDRAEEMTGDLTIMFNRAKRAKADERLKEIITGMKLVGGGSS